MSIKEKLEGLNLVIGLMAIVVGSAVAGTWFVFELQTDLKNLNDKNTALSKEINVLNKKIEKVNFSSTANAKQGPKGDQGPPGQRGPKGERGPTGPQGDIVPVSVIEKLVAEEVTKRLDSRESNKNIDGYKKSKKAKPVFSNKEGLGNVLIINKKLVGQAKNGSRIYPIFLTITSLESNGRMEGKIAWPSLNAVKNVIGGIRGDRLYFNETGLESTEKTKALVGIVYDLKLDISKNSKQLVGNWVYERSNGEIKVDIY